MPKYSTAEKLAQRIKRELKIPVYVPERLPRGRSGANVGQWCWWAKTQDGREVGSPDTMSACIKAKSLVILDRPNHLGNSTEIELCANN